MRDVLVFVSSSLTPELVRFNMQDSSNILPGNMTAIDSPK